MTKITPDTLAYLRLHAGKAANVRAVRDKRLSIKPPKYEPILTGAIKRGVISDIINILQDWRYSQFEYEASCRNGLREALCLQGFSWQRSDNESQLLVNSAITYLGYQRPTWEQGQREYLIARENCAQCGGPVDDAFMVGMRSSSYCSSECASINAQNRALATGKDKARAYVDARDVILRARNPPRNCERCNKVFRPLESKGRFCSFVCTNLDGVEREKRACRACGIMFKPRTRYESKGHYCSLECRSSGGFTTKYDRICIWCNTPFVGKVPTARCCGQRCAVAFSRMKSGKRPPKRISPPVFDYYFIQAG